MFHEDNAMQMEKWECFHDFVSRRLESRSSEFVSLNLMRSDSGEVFVKIESKEK